MGENGPWDLVSSTEPNLPCFSTTWMKIRDKQIMVLKIMLDRTYM